MADSLNNVIATNKFELGYAAMLLEDIPDERMCEQPMPGVNHPAWIIGHLTNTADSLAGWFGGAPSIPDDQKKQLGMGSTPSNNRADYPSKAEMLKQLKEAHGRIHQLIEAADEEHLNGATPFPRLAERLPTIREALTFILVGHVGVHLGQLSTWRRMIGLPPLF